MVGLKEQIEGAKKVISRPRACSDLCVACPLSSIHPKGYGGSFECLGWENNPITLKKWLDQVKKFQPTGREESVRRMASQGDCSGACFSCAFRYICHSAVGGKGNADREFMIALAKAWVVDNPEKAKIPEKTWKPIEKFEKGKWYRYHGKTRLPDWTAGGNMDYVLDGKPRKCLHVGDKPHLAKFLPNDICIWSWRDGFELWEEVFEPSLWGFVQEAKSEVPEKNRPIIRGGIVSIDFSSAFSDIGASFLKTLSQDSPKPVGTPNIPKPIHIVPSRPSRALIGELSKRQSVKPKFTKPLDLRK